MSESGNAAAWSAQQYRLFEDERTRPARDLLAAVPPVQARKVIDLGCGPGNSTELLAVRFSDASVRGVDSSSDMIAAARARLPQLQFDTDDIERWIGGPRAQAVAGEAPAAEAPAAEAPAYDVIFANAVLHWLPDHARLLPRLATRLSPGGALAVQMPDNLDEPAHRLMREIAADGPWASRLAGVSAARPPLAPAEWYYELLHLRGYQVDVWRTTYHHSLAEGAEGVVAWFKGSGLRPFLEPLDADERTVFLSLYQSAVAGAYPTLPDASILLPFPRLFLVVVK